MNEVYKGMYIFSYFGSNTIVVQAVLTSTDNPHLEQNKEHIKNYQSKTYIPRAIYCIGMVS